MLDIFGKIKDSIWEAGAAHGEKRKKEKRLDAAAKMAYDARYGHVRGAEVIKGALAQADKDAYAHAQRPVGTGGMMAGLERMGERAKKVGSVMGNIMGDPIMPGMGGQMPHVGKAKKGKKSQMPYNDPNNPLGIW